MARDRRFPDPDNIPNHHQSSWISGLWTVSPESDASHHLRKMTPEAGRWIWCPRRHATAWVWCRHPCSAFPPQRRHAWRSWKLTSWACWLWCCRRLHRHSHRQLHPGQRSDQCTSGWLQRTIFSAISRAGLWQSHGIYPGPSPEWWCNTLCCVSPRL